jgi:hypothetical protein
LAYKTAKKNSTPRRKDAKGKPRRVQRKGARTQRERQEEFNAKAPRRKDAKGKTRRVQRKGAKAQGRKGKDKKIGHVFRSEADFPFPLIPSLFPSLYSLLLCVFAPLRFLFSVFRFSSPDYLAISNA